MNGTKIKEDIVTMKTNMRKVLGLSILGLLALTACSGTVTAQPSKYEDPLINAPSDFSGEIYNNSASTVYDSIAKAGVGADVLDLMLNMYAVNEFGAYNANVKYNGSRIGNTQVTFDEVFPNKQDLDQYDAGKMNSFVQAHKVYWDSSRSDASAGASSSEVARVKAKYKSIREKIAEAMYEKISTDTYKDRHVFYEERFIKSLRSSLESVAPASETPDCYEEQIVPDVKPEEVFGNYLHQEYYDSASYTYVVDKVLPSIYRQLLTDQYVVDNNYNTLGRSYARNVNVIKIVNNENYPNNAYAFARELVGEINEDPDTYAHSRIKEIGIFDRFNEYSKAQIGVLDDDPDGYIEDIITGAHIQEGVINTGDHDLDVDLTAKLGKFYLGTNYGDLAEKFIKMSDVRHNGVNSEYENTFTNNGAYPATVGLVQEKYTLNEIDNVNDGWFIKNGGLTELPEEIRGRLFNIGVATGVKETQAEIEAMERQYVYDETQAKWVWEEGAEENDYVCRINGQFYLKNGNRVKGEPIENDILHYDSSSKAYYIIQINDAVSSSKLSKTSDRNYEKTSGYDKMQEVINEVTRVVAKNDTYSTLAVKSCLTAMNIEFHDEDVNEYFKKTYPEIFGESSEEESEE